MMSASTLLAYFGLTLIGVFLLLQLAVEILLRSVSHKLKASDLSLRIEGQEPKVWWNKVTFYIGLEKQVPATVAGPIRLMKNLFLGSKFVLAITVVLFLLGNFLQR